MTRLGLPIGGRFLCGAQTAPFMAVQGLPLPSEFLQRPEVAFDSKLVKGQMPAVRGRPGVQKETVSARLSHCPAKSGASADLR